MATVHGEVAAGFEPVREAFECNFDDGFEVGASFAVLRDDEVLVNLWGGHCDRERTRPWREDTLINVWSTTKGMAALVCAMLADRGLLDYDAPVRDYWPEFGGGKRDAITVAMLLSHQAGLSGPRETAQALDFADPARINRQLLAQELLFEPGSTAGYHPISFGSLAGELVERVSGRSLGTFFREEVATPLGVDFHIGLPESEDARVAEMIAPPRRPTGAKRPAGSKRPRAQNEVQRIALGNPLIPYESPNERTWRAAEMPSVNGQGNAAAIARIYEVLANGGASHSGALLGGEALEQATRSRIVSWDVVLTAKVDWAAGFLRNRKGILYGPNPEAFGHSGLGGSFGCADPAQRIGIGYAMNQMTTTLVGDPRSLRLLKAVYESL